MDHEILKSLTPPTIFGLKKTGGYAAHGADVMSFGGKGAHLLEMCGLGLNVPEGIILSTDWCRAYQEDPVFTMGEVSKVVRKAMKDAKLWTSGTGYAFSTDPLVSVRSGAPVSMPGMMDTILNLGIGSIARFNHIRKEIGDTAAKVLRDTYMEAYSELVLGMPKGEKCKLSALPGGWKQVENCIEAVFRSWNTERAKHYRKMHNIPETLGTAVIIQRMVLGNINKKSGTGVMFTRDPSTGENEMVGEWLLMAQGEEVVNGSSIPEKLDTMMDDEVGPEGWDDIHTELGEIAEKLEEHYGEAQDIEFTVEDGKLWILQTRSLKPSARAKFRIAAEMVEESLICKADAVSRVTYADWLASRQTRVSPTASNTVITSGLAASVGIGVGKIVTTVAEVLATDEPTVLYRPETTPDDIKGMEKAVAVITTLGGSTCHAAVVARAMNKPCIVGIGESKALIGAADYGLTVTVDGFTGNIMQGEAPLSKGGDDKHASKIIRWSVNNMNVPIYGPDPRFHEIVLISDWGTRVNEYAMALLEDDKAAKVLVLDGPSTVADDDQDAWAMFGDGDGPGEELTPVVTAFLIEFKNLIEDLTITTDNPTSFAALQNYGYKFPREVEVVGDLLEPGMVTMTEEWQKATLGEKTVFSAMAPLIKATVINNAISEAEAAERFLGGTEDVTEVTG